MTFLTSTSEPPRHEFRCDDELIKVANASVPGRRQGRKHELTSTNLGRARDFGSLETRYGDE